MEKFYYVSPISKNSEFPFATNLIGITFPDANYEIERYNAVTSVIEYVTNGDGTLICGDAEYHIKKGDAYILPQNTYHHYYSNPKNPLEKKWMNFTGRLLEKLTVLYGIENIVKFENINIEPIFNDLFEFCKINSNSDKVNEYGAICLHRMIQVLSSADKHKYFNEISIKAKNYIDSNIYTRITAQDVAKYISISVSQLGRIFKANFDTSVYSYILNRKISLAENLLINTIKPIKEISEDLCFPDEHYFSSIFKKKKGKTPLNFRKENTL